MTFAFAGVQILCSAQTSRVQIRGNASSPFVSGSTPFFAKRRLAWTPHSALSNLRMLIGIVYSTTTGSTQEVAEQIKDILGDKAAEPLDVGDCPISTLESYDGILVGAPTWNTGEDEMRSGTVWDDMLYTSLLDARLSGKSVAVFGCGDSDSYGDSFADAIDELHSCFENQGAKMVGYTSAADYNHTESKSERDGVFVGLPLDEVNESEKTPERLEKWCAQVLKEMDM